MSQESPLGVLDAIRRRRAIRNFAPTPVDEATVHALLNAAVLAPTAIHLEPWSFAVVQDRELLRRLSDRVKAPWAAARDSEPHVAATLPRSSSFLESLRRPDFNVFYDAGTLIVIGARPVGEFAIADCWLAAENLMLAACAMGLGTCVIGCAVRALQDPEVKTQLGIPAEVTPIAPIVVGIPAGAPPPTSRRAPEITSWKRS